MDSVTLFTDPDQVTGFRKTARPTSGQTVSGYGPRIPTSHMIKYAGRWRRVYSMVYGNGATPYIRVRGKDVIIDHKTQDLIWMND